MDVEDIVTEYLLAHGYDGLFDPDVDCGCCVDYLMPCNNAGRNCTPGYKVPSQDEDGAEAFEIVATKPEAIATGQPATGHIEHVDRRA